MITARIVTTDKPFIKKAKSRGKVSQIFVHNKYQGKELTFIPILDDTTEDDIFINTKNEYHIIVETDIIFKKTVPSVNRSSQQIYLPLEYANKDFIIFENH